MSAEKSDAAAVARLNDQWCLTRMSRAKIYKLFPERLLKGRKVGRRTLVLREELGERLRSRPIR